LLENENIKIDIQVNTLQKIVEIEKSIIGPDEKGFYRADPAERLNKLISDFIIKKNFTDYVKDTNNY